MPTGKVRFYDEEKGFGFIAADDGQEQQSRPAEPVTKENFGRITTPTLVLAGEQDKLIPVEDSKAIAAARRAITPATLVRYSIVPRLSLIGLHAFRHA